MNVSILTYCRKPELFYGTELVFKSLRTGFPNARITVLDNASLPETRTEIESLARRNECRFEQIPEPGIPHHEYLQRTIREVAQTADRSEPLVFLDPDICFWESCEWFEFDGLIAGLYMSQFDDVTITKTRTMPRLHTSFLWVPDPANLLREIRKFQYLRFDFEPFLPYSFLLDGTWYRFDTGASLYAAISGKVSCFDKRHLDCYDHLYGGCHIDILKHFLRGGANGEREAGAPGRPDSRVPLYWKQSMEFHAKARSGDWESLRGIWKLQEEAWRDLHTPPATSKEA
jgi:hypothetical protein